MTQTEVTRAFTYRFYPTPAQAAELTRTFGCVRRVYNTALAARTTAWNEHQRRLGYAETSALLTTWKRTEELAFLSLARAVQDASWSALRSMLEYKAHGQGRRVIVVDRWLPSSKTCSGCGQVKDAMPLGERVFGCRACGLVLDRDVNAARNILAAGRAVTACGAGVRPTRP